MRLLSKKIKGQRGKIVLGKMALGNLALGKMTGWVQMVLITRGKWRVDYNGIG